MTQYKQAMLLLDIFTEATRSAPADSIASAITQSTGVRNLTSFSLDDFLATLINGSVKLAINVGIAIVVFIIGRFIINKLYHLVAKVMLNHKVDTSLATFMLSLVKIVLYFILIVTVIGILGIETSSFLAIFASAGVAIGMALSGTLQNFAGGVLILFLKPYKVGDYIEAQGYSGRVTEIQIFHTIICTPDNKSIIIPNGGLSTGSINNWSREQYRRVDWTVGISYGDDVDAARRVILGLLKADQRVVTHYIEDDAREREAEVMEQRRARLQQLEEESRNMGFFKRMVSSSRRRRAEQAIAREAAEQARISSLRPHLDCMPVVRVDSLGESSVNLTVRAWTRSEYYWDVYFDINEKIYNTLPANGVSFPYPQMDVHVVKE